MEFPELSNWDISNVDRLFALCDVDKSGVLELSEVPRLLRALGHRVDDLDGEEAVEINELFQRLDTDRNGRIDRVDLLHLVHEVRVNEAARRNAAPVETEDSKKRAAPKVKFDPLLEYPMRGTSCGCLSRGTRARRACHAVFHSRVRNIISCVIIFASGTWVGNELKVGGSDLERSMGSSGFNAVALILGVFFVLVLALDIAVGVTAHGAWSLDEKRSYYRPAAGGWWRGLDTLLLIFNVMAICVPPDADSGLVRAVNVIKSTRLLALLSRTPKARIMAEALLSALPQVGVLLVGLLIVELAFGALGVIFFSGTFARCLDGSDGYLPALDGASFDSRAAFEAACSTAGGTFDVPRHNYDFISNALLSGYQVLLVDGFWGLLVSGVDSTGLHAQPRPYASPWYFVYFVAHVVLGALFYMNVFIGTVVYNFESILKRSNGLHVLTEEQEAWVETQRLMQKQQLPPLLTPPSTAPWRLACFYLVTPSPLHAPLDSSAPDRRRHYGDRFSAATNVLIVLNLGLMVCYTPRMGATISLMYTSANIVFSLLFAAEAAVKLAGLGRRQYFRDPWNVFDFALVFASFITAMAFSIDYFIGLSSEPISLTYLRALRIVRLGRSLRSFRLLMLTLRIAAPANLNISMLLYIILYVYAMLGMTLFGGAAWTESACGINRHAHFDEIYVTVLTLFRLATGDNWSCLYVDAQAQRFIPGVPVPYSAFVHMYFLSFMLIMVLVVSVFSAIVLAYYGTQAGLKVGDEELRHFSSRWVAFDPERSLYLPVSRLGQLLLAIGPPLVAKEVRRSNGRTKLVPLPPAELKTLLARAGRLVVPVRDGKVHYVEVLVALVAGQVGESMVGHAGEVQRRIMAKWPVAAPSVIALPAVDSYTYNFIDEILEHTPAARYALGMPLRGVAPPPFPECNTLGGGLPVAVEHGSKTDGGVTCEVDDAPDVVEGVEEAGRVEEDAYAEREQHELQKRIERLQLEYAERKQALQQVLRSGNEPCTVAAASGAEAHVAGEPPGLPAGRDSQWWVDLADCVIC